MKSNKENILSDILIELSKGTTYTDCLGLFGTKWNLPKTTFTRYWNIALERHANTQNIAQNAINDISIATTKEAVKNGLKSKLERQLELQAMLDPTYKTNDVAVFSRCSCKVKYKTRIKFCKHFQTQWCFCIVAFIYHYHRI